MDADEKQSFIQAKAWQLNIKWSSHALGELTPDNLSAAQVETALRDAIVIEDYPHLRRHLPDCLVLAFVTNEPIHSVVAINVTHDYILIVTVYRPENEEWQHDWRTRK